MIVLRKHKQPSSADPICPSYTTALSLARALVAGPGPAFILPHLLPPSYSMGLCEDFWQVLRFPTHCSSLQGVLQRDLLTPRSYSCLCYKWLFSPVGVSTANPEPHSLGEGGSDLMLTEHGLCRWLLTTTAEQFSSRTWGSTQFSHVGKEQSPKAGCLKHGRVLPCSVPCCTGSSAAGGSLAALAAAALQGSGWRQASSFCSFWLLRPPHPSSHTELCSAALLITKWSKTTGSNSSWMHKGNWLRRGRGTGARSQKLQCKIAVCLTSQWPQTCPRSQVFPPQWTLDSLNESPVSYLGGFCVEIISI